MTVNHPQIQTAPAPAGPVGVQFPPGFLWGAATAAFQIEGSTRADGRTDSIWDAFCRVPGAVVGGDTGEVAADHYRRMREDVRLMARLGLGAYRFSVAWPRVRPDGGALNPAGLDFYSRLVDELLEHGITPWVTLYHWDLPQVLEQAGGWANRDTAWRFAEYAESVHAVLGDRVPFWTTLNEPWCSALLGYAAGVHAPGRRDRRAAVAAVHHLLLAHGLGVRAIRARDAGASVGITLNFADIVPADPADPVDVEAARRLDGLQNRLFLQPVMGEGYPADVWADLEPFGLAEYVQEGDLETISAPIDVLGVNYYTGNLVSGHPEPTAPAGPNGSEEPDGAASVGSARPTGSPWVGAEYVRFVDRPELPRTDMGWEVVPRGLSDLLVRIGREYPQVALYVTENGAAYPDVVDADGRVEDPERVAYLEAHLRACHAAIEAGVDLRGYFLWSLMDNFEWAEGYAKRFGMVHVDYDTQVRTVKSSGLWYSRVIATNSLPAPENR